MKKPNECKTIDEVRNEIDFIDKQIISLISTRYSFVKEIVKYKSSSVDVKAQKRYDEVFEVRRKWAEETGISADLIEEIYKTLVHYFIDEQMKLLNNNNN
jgi:isochorismate pyruvate lyase